MLINWNCNSWFSTSICIRIYRAYINIYKLPSCGYVYGNCIVGFFREEILIRNFDFEFWYFYYFFYFEEFVFLGPPTQSIWYDKYYCISTKWKAVKACLTCLIACSSQLLDTCLQMCKHLAMHLIYNFLFVNYCNIQCWISLILVTAICRTDCSVMPASSDMWYGIMSLSYIAG